MLLEQAPPPSFPHPQSAPSSVTFQRARARISCSRPTECRRPKVATGTDVHTKYCLVRTSYSSNEFRPVGSAVTAHIRALRLYRTRKRTHGAHLSTKAESTHPQPRPFPVPHTLSLQFNIVSPVPHPLRPDRQTTPWLCSGSAIPNSTHDLVIEDPRSPL